MSDNTKIEWADATANYINGCSVVSPGCKHCYAMKQAHRFPVRQGLTTHTAGGMVWTGEVRANEKVLQQVLGWKRPRAIFWNAHGDTFHENVPDETIDRMFAVMALTPQHRHMVLTKRSARMREYFEDRATISRVAVAIVGVDLSAPLEGKWWPLPNVWLGVSVEDQQRADERIPDLLASPAAIRFLSCEPLIGPLDLRKIYLRRDGQRPTKLSNTLGDFVQPLRGNFRGSAIINWIIAGGESGPKARPMHPAWARSLRDQCAAADVPFLFKQWGEWFPGDLADDGAKMTACPDAEHDPSANQWEGRWGFRLIENEGMLRVGKKRAGRLLDGVEHDGLPLGASASATGAD